MRVSRYHVLRLIHEQPMTTHEVARALGITTKKASFHICKLKQEEMVYALETADSYTRYAATSDDAPEAPREATIPGARVFACRHTQGNGRYFLPNADGFGI